MNSNLYRTQGHVPVLAITEVATLLLALTLIWLGFFGIMDGDVGDGRNAVPPEIGRQSKSSRTAGVIQQTTKNDHGRTISSPPLTGRSLAQLPSLAAGRLLLVKGTDKDFRNNELHARSVQKSPVIAAPGRSHPAPGTEPKQVMGSAQSASGSSISWLAILPE